LRGGRRCEDWAFRGCGEEVGMMWWDVLGRR
jgi:hypothetical protein